MWRWNCEEESEVRCAYCGFPTDDHYNPGRWNVSFKDFSAAFGRIDLRRIYGLPKNHPHSMLRGDIVERKTSLHICPKCGWWVAEDRAILPAIHWQHWTVTLASAPALVEMSLDDIELPLGEVRRYLSRAFEQKALMHPRLFELTVASVFGDFGYDPIVTAYSNDGGIDIVLQAGSGERIGVQVKRQKRAVEVEQIRAFLGALVIGGFRRGAYVSSSHFTKGAIKASRKISETVMPIELVDAERLFEALGAAQLKNAPQPEDCIGRTESLMFHLHACYHLNSL